MDFKIAAKGTSATVYLIDTAKTLDQFNFNKEEKTYALKALGNKRKLFNIQLHPQQIFICHVQIKSTDGDTAESIRKAGAEMQSILKKEKLENLYIQSHSEVSGAAYNFAEGLALANYQFLKYKSDAAKMISSIKTISFEKSSISTQELAKLTVLTTAIGLTRDLVNEPLSYLSATQLSKDISAMGKDSGFKVTVMNMAKITSEKMGGILAVNRGSIDPPTFTIMEYKAAKAKNKKPIVLVGKGIVYDTGGLSLKPTPNSMDKMKSDMSGAALVSGVMYAIAKLKLPLHVIALVPATDNRPGGNAYVPGDVITQYGGTTVEVLNTDAEGRLVLADALHWAKRYKPELVMDFATLTGAAAAAVGDVGIVCMGTASDDTKGKLRESGYRQYERLVEMPLWDEYADLLKSEVADLKNVGGPAGGAITAGKFLQHFTDYPWMHFDIAGVSFGNAKKDYRTEGATAYGLRMVVDFLSAY